MLTTVERDELGGFKMVFKPNQVVVLPERAAQVGLALPEFKVDRIIKSGMGECIRIVQSERSFALKVIQGELVEDSEAGAGIFVKCGCGRRRRPATEWWKRFAFLGSTSFLWCVLGGWEAAI
jgi:hypothetical protein